MSAFDPFTGSLVFGRKQCDKTSVRTIPAGATLVVDTIDKDLFCSLDYYICLSKGTSFLPKTLNLRVWKSDTEVKDQVYSRSTGAVMSDIDSSLTASDYNLTIVNRELVDIEIKFIKRML